MSGNVRRYVVVLIDAHGRASVSEKPVYGAALIVGRPNGKNARFEPIASKATDDGTWVRVLREARS